MENINQNDFAHSELDDDYESDGEIGNVLDNEEYNKPNYLIKIEELVKKGHNFTETYSMTNSVEELKSAYLSNIELFNQNLIKNNLIGTREYFLKESDLQYYLDNLMTSGVHASKLLKKDAVQYIIKHDQELWQKLTQIVLYFLRSEIVQKYINVGFDWIKQNVSLSNQYLTKLKKTILTLDENTFVKLKKATMEINYKFISAVKDDEEIEHENKQNIIKMLIKINSIVAEIKETTDELIQQIEEIFSSDDKVLEFTGQIKDFILTNLDCVISHDIFYYKHIIPQVEHNIINELHNLL